LSRDRTLFCPDVICDPKRAALRKSIRILKKKFVALPLLSYGSISRMATMFLIIGDGFSPHIFRVR
jgi:hypothetical protein